MHHWLVRMLSLAAVTVCLLTVGCHEPAEPNRKIQIHKVERLDDKDVPSSIPPRDRLHAAVYRLTVSPQDLDTIIDGGRHISMKSGRCDHMDAGRFAHVDLYLDGAEIGRRYSYRDPPPPFSVLAVAHYIREESYRCAVFEYYTTAPDATFGSASNISNVVRFPPPPAMPGAPPVGTTD